MNLDSKTLLCAWWIFFLLSMFLWYRNYKYDRALSVYIFLLGLIQLCEFAFINGSESKSTSKLIYSIIWLQPVVLLFSTFIFLKLNNSKKYLYNICFILFMISLFLFFYKIYEILYRDDFFMEFKNNEILLKKGDYPLLHGWYYIYFAFIALSLFLILVNYNFIDIPCIILLIYLIFTAFYVYIITNQEYYYMSIWTLMATGFALLAWMGGLGSQILVFNY